MVCLPVSSVCVVLLVALPCSLPDSIAAVTTSCAEGYEECSDEIGLLHLQGSQKAKAKAQTWSKVTLATADDIKHFLEHRDFDLHGVSKGFALDLLHCAMVTCVNFLNPDRREDCNACVKSLIDTIGASPIGVNGVPLSYAIDMVSIPAAGDYVNAWCSGNLADCNTRSNFPGQNTTSIMDWESVWKIGSETPKMQWSGQWWRGNELGFIINNPYFWSGSGINPFSNILGILPSQHAAIRSVMERMFGTGTHGLQAMVDEYIEEFLKEKAQVGLVVSDDLKELVYRVLNRAALNRSVSVDSAKEFVSLQAQVTALGTVSQLFPASLYSFLEPIRTRITEYIDEYEPLVDALYGEELSKEDCSPSPSCSRLVASMLFDTLYSAGGLSVPTTMSTGLGVLFSKDESNPFPQASYPVDQALEFYWENVRYFAPVVGFPHWETRPTCAGRTVAETSALNAPQGQTKACPLGPVVTQGYPAVNQYQGGVRVVPNMALAQRDPRVWGPDGNKFVIRPLAAYKKSVGFAEMAVDSTVEHGRMNRVCPGKTLALMIGSSFFTIFDKSSWAEPRIPITFGSGPTYVGSFTLSSKSMVADCKEVCPSCGVSASCLAAKMQCEAAKAKCSFCKSCKEDPPKWWNPVRKGTCYWKC